MSDMQSKLIITERLILRSMYKTDYNDFYEYFTDPMIQQFLGGYPPSADEVRCIFEHNCKSKYLWAIVLKETGKIIGDVHFGNIVDNYLAYIGYIINRTYCGMGYGTEAIKAAVNYGFSEAEFGRIRAIIHSENESSKKVLVKSGFIKECELQEADFDGRIADIVYYSQKNPK